MSDMIERVARAIAKAHGFDDYVSEMYIELARAAIKAMREPTKEMIEPGYEAINECIDFWNYESDTGYSVDAVAPSQTWRAMIDAALAPSKPKQ